jgi:NTE family protein
MKNAVRHILLTIMVLAGVVEITAQPETLRPKVAVVLSGGGAKGMAHIGVLKVLERAGIPIDIITGTSMGGIVGGLYSCGWNATLLDSVVKKQDWQFLLSDRSLYYDQDLQTRQNLNTYALSKVVTLGHRKVNEAGGFITGQNLMKLFGQMTSPYTDSINFDSLPIPFACVATDIVNNTEYIFRSGVIAEAMRTTMAIPGVFSPVRYGDMVLVDGGLRNNYPADIAKDMGATYIIGATVQGPPRTADELVNWSTVLTQIVDVNTKNKYDENLAITDIPIRVNTKGYSPASFNRAAIDTLIRRGEEEAMKHWDEIMALKSKLGLDSAYRPSQTVPDSMALLPVKFTDPAPSNRPPQDQVRGSLGIRFDTEEMVALKLNGIYSSSRRPFDVEATLRLGRNIMAGGQMAWKANKQMRMVLGYNYRYNDIDIYEAGRKDYSITFDNHQLQWSMKGISMKNFEVDVTAQWDYYNYRNVLISSKLGHDPFTLNNEHFFTYMAQLHYNSENDWQYPNRGARFLASYAYVTDNMFEYHGHVGFSELTASWRKSFALNGHLTLQPMLYGRMLFGGDIPNIRRNTIGGMWFGHYVDQQIPFVGVHHLEYADNHIIIGQLTLQQQLTTNNFLVLKLAEGQQANQAGDLLKSKPLIGCGLAYWYRTMFGPIGGSLSYSNQTDRISLFINLGFFF